MSIVVVLTAFGWPLHSPPPAIEKMCKPISANPNKFHQLKYTLQLPIFLENRFRFVYTNTIYTCNIQNQCNKKKMILVIFILCFFVLFCNATLFFFHSMYRIVCVLTSCRQSKKMVPFSQLALNVRSQQLRLDVLIGVGNAFFDFRTFNSANVTDSPHKYVSCVSSPNHRHRIISGKLFIFSFY